MLCTLQSKIWVFWEAKIKNFVKSIENFEFSLLKNIYNIYLKKSREIDK